jgi:hypothetical protein
MQNRMIDRIRKSQLSSQMMQVAARGALAVDSGEMMEILVYLALHNKLFAEQARMTLAGWDEKASAGVAANPATSKEVLDYLVSPKNIRPALLTSLIENPSVARDSLRDLAATGARWVVEALLANETAKKIPVLMDALRTNPRLRANELSSIDHPGQMSEPSEPAASTADKPSTAPVPETTAFTPPAAAALAESDDSEAANEPVVTQALTSFLQQNQAEIATAPDKPFELVVVHEGTGLEGGTEAAPVATAVVDSPTVPEQPKAAAPSAAAAAKKAVNPLTGETRRDSTLQKIAKLDIKGRIALAMRGNKEERSLLIRDSTKLVALAVLDSPKVSEGEVEKFALQKNVLEAVLRAIPMKRTFMKNYSIVRNLVFNPRTPLDLSLGLMKNLLIGDLRNLSGNKEVSDTVRKLAIRMFKQKSEKGSRG